jgi:hypothetical protein
MWILGCMQIYRNTYIENTDTHIFIYANIWIAFIRKDVDIYVFRYLRILVFECLYVWVLSYTQI